MKIKLAILEKDESYMNRIVAVFSTKYSDKFQVYSFTNPEMALATVEREKIDVLIASDLFEIKADKLPPRCSFAYFVNSPDVATVYEQRAICKFQKAELIYKQILSIYSENAGSLSGIKMTDDVCKVTVFSSPCGGVGTSTVCASYALHLASLGKKVMYLNLEDFGSTDIYFNAEGQFDMSDVIFSLKSKKANIAMKLESYVKLDPRGVNFFSQAKYSLDMLELNDEERLTLIDEIKMTGNYEYLVIDMGFGLDKNHIKFYEKAHNIVLVCDGSECSDYKIHRAFEALSTIDGSLESPIANRFSLLYNRFSSKTGKMIEDSQIRVLGGAPVFSYATVQQIMSQLYNNNMFDKLD